MRETFDGVVEIMNPMAARAESEMAAKLFPSEIFSLPTVRQREVDDAAWGGGDILEVCGQVDVSLGIIAPTALENNKTAFGVAGWLNERFSEYKCEIKNALSAVKSNSNSEKDVASLWNLTMGLLLSISQDAVLCVSCMIFLKNWYTS